MERHSTDALSLVFGLLFSAVAVVGLTDLLHLTEGDVRWAGPGLLVLLGVVLVLTAGRRRSTNGRSREPASTASAADEAPAADMVTTADTATTADEDVASEDVTDEDVTDEE